jgi:hypothetical protein
MAQLAEAAFGRDWDSPERIEEIKATTLQASFHRGNTSYTNLLDRSDRQFLLYIESQFSRVPYAHFQLRSLLINASDFWQLSRLHLRRLELSFGLR